VRRITAAFAVAYSGAGYAPRPTPAVEAMFTIAPPPSRSITGTAKWIARSTEPRLSSISCSDCSSGTSGNTGSVKPPALLTRIVGWATRIIRSTEE